MSILEIAEDALSCRIACSMDHLSHMYGIEACVYDQVKTPYSNAYGTSSGDVSLKSIGKAKVILIGADDFSSFSPSLAGSFDEAFVYSTSQILKPGQILEIVRSDKRKRQFKITGVEQVGNTKILIKRYRLSSVGDKS